MDHETSGSDVVTAIVCANQQRQWGKPTGSPGANYTHWRILCRRVDTNEFNFYKVADVPVGTASYTESVSDTARRQASVGPFSSANNKPPAFAFMAEYKGFGFGVPADDSSLYVTRAGDLQSVDPAHRIYVRRGDGQCMRPVRPFGDTLLIQRDHASFYVDADAMPLVPRPLHSSWGNVSQESGLEVDGLFDGWDRDKGPYETDTVNWRSLASGRIQAYLATLSRKHVHQIEAAYDETNHLILWAIPTGVSARKRTIPAWHVDLRTWLPPITGLEWSSFTTFTNPSTGAAGLFVGDEWGRVFEMFSGTREGVPVTVTATTLTGTVLSLDTTNDAPFTRAPQAGDLYIVGGIQWFWWTPWLDFDLPDRGKQLWQLFVQMKATSTTHPIAVTGRFNDEDGVIANIALTIQSGNLASAWGVAVWGESLWGAVGRRASPSASIAACSRASSSSCTIMRTSPCRLPLTASRPSHKPTGRHDETRH